MIEQLLIWAVQTLLTIVLLIPLVWLACRVFRYRPAVQHALWLILLVKFVTPSVVVWPWQFDEIASGLFQTSEPHSESVSIGTDESIDDEQLQSLIEIAATSYSISENDEREGNVDTIDAAQSTYFDWMPLAVLCVWLAGIVAFMGRQILVICRHAHRLRSCQPAENRLRKIADVIALLFHLPPVTVVVGDGFSSPAVTCWYRLRLIWPSRLRALPDAAAQAVMAHEFAHVCRRDHIVAWLELLASAVWWWNPLYWYVRNQLRTTAEMACDAVALSAFPEHRCVYAETLLWLSASPKTGVLPLILAVGSSTPSSFERRMSMIVCERASGKVTMPGIAAMAILGCLVVPTWSLAQADEKVNSVTLTSSDEPANTTTPDGRDPVTSTIDVKSGLTTETLEDAPKSADTLYRDKVDLWKALVSGIDETDATENRKADGEAANVSADGRHSEEQLLSVSYGISDDQLQKLRKVVAALKEECDNDRPNPKVLAALLHELKLNASESDSTNVHSVRVTKTRKGSEDSLAEPDDVKGESRNVPSVPKATIGIGQQGQHDNLIRNRLRKMSDEKFEPSSTINIDDSNAVLKELLNTDRRQSDELQQMKDAIKRLEAAGTTDSDKPEQATY